MEQEHKQGELSIGNFQKYPVLLKQIKQRVAVPQSGHKK